MTNSKITLQTITLLPVEVGEEGYRNIGDHIKEKERKNKERYKYFKSYESLEAFDERIVHVGQLKEVGTIEKAGVHTDIYSTRVVGTYSTEVASNDDSNMKHTSICLTREKEVEVDVFGLSNSDKIKKIKEVVNEERELRRKLDNFLDRWNKQSRVEGKDEERELDSDFNSYRDSLSDIGLPKKEKQSQLGPKFHYTFYIVNCSKEYSDVAKNLAYSLNSSVLELALEPKDEPDDLFIPNTAELNEALTEKINSPLELYLLAGRSTFVILCVGVNADNKISEVAKFAAIRTQSVRNSCYFYTEDTDEELSYLDGQKLLSLLEAVLTRSISSTRDTLSDRILEKLIEPSGILLQLKSFRDLIASKKVKEEKEKEKDEELEKQRKEYEEKQKTRKTEKSQRRLQTASAIQSIILGIIGVFIAFFPSGISPRALALAALFVALPVVVLALVTIALVPPWRKRVKEWRERKELEKQGDEDNKTAFTKSEVSE